MLTFQEQREESLRTFTSTELINRINERTPRQVLVSKACDVKCYLH